MLRLYDGCITNAENRYEIIDMKNAAFQYASGKGTITKIVAQRLNLVSIDTGAMYVYASHELRV